MLSVPFLFHFLSACLFPFLSASRVHGSSVWPGCDDGCGWATVVFHGSWVSAVVCGGFLRWFFVDSGSLRWVLRFDIGEF